MSYLDDPRLHFNGWFQADICTVNNDVRLYQNESFVREYQATDQNGSWNPEGTGIFRMLDCSVTGAFLRGQLLTTAADDPVIGMTLQNAHGRAPAKLVDLDPQHQTVSQIWGLQVRLLDAVDNGLLQGEYKPAAFSNLWQRQQDGLETDMILAAYYQSVLEDVVWSETNSQLLRAMRAAADDNMLSISFNLYGYGRDSTMPRYTMGHVTGTIGPYRRGEPKHFVLGRQLIAFTPEILTQPVGNIHHLQAKLDGDSRSLTLDFGNSLPILDANRGLADIGRVLVGVLNHNPLGRQEYVKASDFELIGELPYLEADWYTQTAGVQTFDLTKKEAARALLSRCPLVLLSPSDIGANYDVLLQESIDGLYVRADSFVCRINPGETEAIDLYASRFGRALRDAVINFAPNEGLMGGSGSGDTVSPPTRPYAEVPTIATPADAISYPPSILTNADGHASLPVSASPNGPGTPRGYISGQVYGIGYELAIQPADYIGNPLNYVSILAHDRKEVPEVPTWYQDIQPLFTQYANLYPIMTRHVVDLSDYAVVVSRIKILKLVFSLPARDPNHMPVGRDLSAGDRATILKWLDSRGPDGLPVLGTPMAALVTADDDGPAAASSERNEESDGAFVPLQSAGKTAVLLQYEKRRKASGGDVQEGNE
jgi:hypothetical protein